MTIARRWLRLGVEALICFVIMLVWACVTDNHAAAMIAAVGAGNCSAFAFVGFAEAIIERRLACEEDES